MPITSSITAAETMVVPSFVFILPSSLSTDTVIATLVAVSIVPMNTQRKMFAVPRPMLPKGRLITRPSTKGTATPAQAISTLARPVFLRSLMFVSSPAENIIKITPTLESTSTVSLLRVSSPVVESTILSSANSALYSPSLTSDSNPMSV